MKRDRKKGHKFEFLCNEGRRDHLGNPVIIPMGEWDVRTALKSSYYILDRVIRFLRSGGTLNSSFGKFWRA